MVYNMKGFIIMKKNRQGLEKSSLVDRRKFIAGSAIASLAAINSEVLAGSKLIASDSSPVFSDSETKNVVVVGSGIGGLATAALLAKEGHHVTVLEANDRIGGQGRTKQFNGLNFSMGPQYCWFFGEGEIGDRFLKRIGIENSSPFVQMPEQGFETIFLGENKGGSKVQVYAIPMGMDRFKRYMVDLFPEDHKLAAWFEYMEKALAEISALTTSRKNDGGDQGIFEFLWNLFRENPVKTLKSMKYVSMVFMSLKDTFDLFSLSPEVRRVLYGHGGIFVENESVVSAIAYYVATRNYHGGASYPQRSFRVFFEEIKKSIENTGGTVRINQKVTKLHREGRKIVGAECVDGSYYPCDVLISNIAPKLTAELIAEDRFSPQYTYTPGPSIPTLCIGLKPGYPGFREGLRGRNYWWLDNKGETDYINTNINDRPQMLFIASSTARGFGNTVENTDDDALTIYFVGNYQQEAEIHNQGSEAYDRMKRRLTDQVLTIVNDNVLPGIRDYVKFTALTTSVDTLKEIGTEQGNAYGKRMNVREMISSVSFPDDGYDNLYNVSSTAKSAGIASGIGSGAELLRILTGKRM